MGECASAVRMPPSEPARPNEQWVFDIMSDGLLSTKRLRLWKVIAICLREVLTASDRTSIPAAAVTVPLDRAEQIGASDGSFRINPNQ